jgi:Fe-S-cluster containining protein
MIDGIRFQCQGSGRCCLTRDGYGYVYVTLHDRRLLAAHLGLTTLQFTRRHTEKTDGWLHLKHPDQPCPFLAKSRCRVYRARPTQCRTWPFWRENMDARIWRKEVAAVCPGIGKGKHYTAEEIEQILETQHDVPAYR